ncbi:type I restriction-modification system subunit M [Streptomyces salyersiae]|uniref:site-specific DNA-methyltransferase (adenine-specific) n=1 Tax=Streptomyces salyersiae TaxID=3075530 RepID=A0ABU2RG83_9ACTN|nr:class I SAM-dependent DNA methyltransferase [Streptomyces sp. DSM 41770]MDT0427868.1 class I SAM-dependent DNA methyltransferase [Streptomyces sp. DSM 41770]
MAGPDRSDAPRAAASSTTLSGVIEKRHHVWTSVESVRSGRDGYRVYSAQQSRIESFIWGIADDVLRDVYVRGKYRDVILPMLVLRRFDAVLEKTKDDVLRTYQDLKSRGLLDPGLLDLPLREVAGEAFYNTSPFTLQKLAKRTTAEQLRIDFVAYLDGFSPNVKEILNNFEFTNQIPKLTRNGTLGMLINKLLSSEINLSPEPVLDAYGHIRLPGLDNHAMGTIFENLVRRFNEENNEEAGEHWTPRDVVKLMTRLMFLPVADKIKGGTYLLYDGACGTGGMLTVAEETLRDLSSAHGGNHVVTRLYGQEINSETYAICKADMLLKGDGEAADNIKGGPEWSTLSNDAFPLLHFDFMLANPPYGKSWKADQERLGGKDNISDPRFNVVFAGDTMSSSLVTSSSDGQMMFLANMVSKMKPEGQQGSRIAEIHNGSSLFTGDAGSGESNIRRWIIENDWLEAIIALPLNMFYNTGIATYIWVITNRKSEARKGKVQLIDATGRSTPLRKNLGSKNCELSPADAEHVTQAFQNFTQTEHSKIFPNDEFGYWKVTVERPLRLRSQFTKDRVQAMRFASGDAAARELLYEKLGNDLYTDFKSMAKQVREQLNLWARATGPDEDEVDADVPVLKEAAHKKLLNPATWERDGQLVTVGTALLGELGEQVFDDYNEFDRQAGEAMSRLGCKLSAADRKALLRGVSWRDETAKPVILKRHKAQTAPRPLYGLYEIEDPKSGRSQPRVVEYEPDSELRDTEQVSLLEDGGIETFFRREVLPYVEDAWIKESATKKGYEVSFSRYFYKLPVLRSLEDIRADIVALEKETEGLLGDLFDEGSE